MRQTMTRMTHQETRHEPAKPVTKGRSKEATNGIMAKINSAASCDRNEETQSTIEEIGAELGKK